MKLSQTNGPILHFYDGDLHSSLVHLKNAGFKYVDISFWSRYLSGSPYFKTDNEIIAEEYKRELETLELIPVQSHEPFGNSLGNDGGRFYFRKTPLAIDLAGKIGIPSITLHAGIEVPAMSMSREEYMSKNAEIFRKLIPYAEKYGTRLLIENTAWKNDGVHLAGADDLNEILGCRRISPSQAMTASIWLPRTISMKCLTVLTTRSSAYAGIQVMQISAIWTSMRRSKNSVPVWRACTFTITTVASVPPDVICICSHIGVISILMPLFPL